MRSSRRSSPRPPGEPAAYPAAHSVAAGPNGGETRVDPRHHVAVVIRPEVCGQSPDGPNPIAKRGGEPAKGENQS